MKFTRPTILLGLTTFALLAAFPVIWCSLRNPIVGSRLPIMELGVWLFVFLVAGGLFVARLIAHR